MKAMTFLFAFLIWMVVACSKDDAPQPKDPDPVQQPDPKPDPESENRPPGGFALLAPETDAKDTARTPTFTWEPATDPDGDTVTYDLYLFKEDTPATLVAEALNTTNFKIAVKLDLDTTYQWKVVAKDGEGLERNSEIRSFVTVQYLFLKNATHSNINTSTTFEYPFTYSNGKLTASRDSHSGAIWSIFYTSEGKVDRLSSSNGTYGYSYNGDGKLAEIATSDNGHFWKYSYDEQDRLSEILVKFPSGLRPYTLKYTDHPTLPGEIWTNGLLSHLLQWDIADNLIKWEVLGSIGEVITSVSFTYDDKRNPLYPIVKKKLAINTLYYSPVFYPSGEWSLVSDVLKWIGKNNLTGLTTLGTFETSYSYEYEYNQDGYPFSATLTGTTSGNPASSFTYTWDYLEDE